MVFYDNFIRLCETKGHSPTRVLTALGISRGSLGRWKDGGEPRNEYKKAIADYLEITVPELMSGEIEKPAPQTEDELNTEVIKLYERLNVKNQAVVLEIAKSLLSTQ